MVELQVEGGGIERARAMGYKKHKIKCIQNGRGHCFQPKKTSMSDFFCSLLPSMTNSKMCSVALTNKSTEWSSAHNCKYGAAEEKLCCGFC